VLKGDAPPRMGLTFDTLMTGSEDEPSSYYGLVGETVDVSDGANVFVFHLRDTPRFHDGSPLTADDVAFSLTLLRDKGHPAIAEVIKPMAKAEASDPRTLVVTLDGKQTRETILTVAGPADLLQGLLHRPPVRFVLARPAARLQRLQGRQRIARSLHRVRARA